MGVAIRGLLLSTGIGALIVGISVVVPALYRWWKATSDPEQRLPRLRDRLGRLNDSIARVTDRIAELEAANRRVDPRLRATASRLAHQRRALERSVAETERLRLASSDLGRALEALAARDMAAWSGASEEAQQRARDLAGDLPAAEQEMAALALAVREFARAGKLTPAVLREIASRIRALGVDAADLPPELRNIIVALDRLEQSSEDAGDAAGGLGEGLGDVGDGAGRAAQAFRELVAAEIESIRASERQTEVRRAAVAALHEERVAAGQAWLAGQPGLPVSTGPIAGIVGGSSEPPPMPAWIAGIGGGSVGGVIEIEIRPEYSSGPPPPPPPAWIGRVQEIGHRWGRTFARAFEGGGDVAGALQSILTTEAGGALSAGLGRLTSRVSGWAGGLGGGVGQALGGALSAGLGAIMPLVGPALGALATRIGGALKRLFGGPSAAELAGRETAEGWLSGLRSGLSSGQIAEAAASGWDDADLAASWIGMRDAALEAGLSIQQAEGFWRRMQAAIPLGDAAVAQVRAEFEVLVDAAGAAAAAQEALWDRAYAAAVGAHGRATAAGERAAAEATAAHEQYLAAVAAGDQRRADRLVEQHGAWVRDSEATAAQAADAQIAASDEVLAAEGERYARTAAFEAALAAIREGNAAGAAEAARQAAEQTRTAWDTALGAVVVADQAATDAIRDSDAAGAAADAEAAAERRRVEEELTALREQEAEARARQAEAAAQREIDAAKGIARGVNTALAGIRDREVEIKYRGRRTGTHGGVGDGGGGEGAIPALAAGGIVRRPTLALIGESGPELVAPLSDLRPAGAGAADFRGVEARLDAANEALARLDRTLPRRLVQAWVDAAALS